MLAAYLVLGRAYGLRPVEVDALPATAVRLLLGLASS
jgi:hypothetical protein